MSEEPARLWTPWRMAYIKGPKPKDEGCIFCEKVKEADDAKNYILYRGKLGYLMLNLYPYANGHMMAIPYRHVANLDELTVEETSEMMQLAQRGIRALRCLMRPEGFNVGINMGKIAGAGVADHVHLHVVPRWAGDTNFMPVLADVRLIPELLEQTYQGLLDVGIADPEKFNTDEEA